MKALTKAGRRHHGGRGRLVLIAVLVGVAGLLAAACGGGDDEAATAADCEAGATDGDLAFYNWAEYIDEELLAAFEAETGINVEYTTYESNEEMLTKVQSEAAIYDLVVPSDYMVDTMRREGCCWNSTSMPYPTRPTSRPSSPTRRSTPSTSTAWPTSGAPPASA